MLETLPLTSKRCSLREKGNSSRKSAPMSNHDERRTLVPGAMAEQITGYDASPKASRKKSKTIIKPCSIFKYTYSVIFK